KTAGPGTRPHKAANSARKAVFFITPPSTTGVGDDGAERLHALLQPGLIRTARSLSLGALKLLGVGDAYRCSDEILRQGRRWPRQRRSRSLGLVRTGSPEHQYSGGKQRDALHDPPPEKPSTCLGGWRLVVRLTFGPHLAQRTRYWRIVALAQQPYRWSDCRCWTKCPLLQKCVVREPHTWWGVLQLWTLDGQVIAPTRESTMLRRRIACTLLLYYLAACMSWHVEEEVSPLQVISAQHPRTVRLTRTDGSRVVLDEPRIAAGDSVVGVHYGVPSSVAVSDVTQVA